MNTNPIREWCDWVAQDPLTRQAMINQQENTRRAAAEQDFLRDYRVRATVVTPSDEQAREYGATAYAAAQGLVDSAKLTRAHETTYVVEESKQLPVHEQEQQL